MTDPAQGEIPPSPSRNRPPGADALASLEEITRNLAGRVTAKLVREYVRTVMIEPVVKRMYDIGMGVETFDVPTAIGRIVNVPASASVQVRALQGLLQVGVPTQLGLVDDDGNALPGVVALGELDMRSVQESNLPRLGQAMRAFGDSANGNGADSTAEAAVRLDAALSPGMAERIEQGEFEIVEVVEGDSTPRSLPDAPPPPIDQSTMTPEQRILAKRRARRSNGNGR